MAEYILVVILLSINTLMLTIAAGAIVWFFSGNQKAVVLTICLSIVPAMFFVFYLNANPITIFLQDLPR